MSSSDDGFEKLRVLHPGEEFFEVAKEYAVFNSAYQITLASASALTEDTFRCVLTHLQRKVPSLMYCIRFIDGKYWFCKMKEQKLDFEVVTNKNPMKILDDILATKFNCEEGPIWTCRLLMPEHFAPQGKFAYHYDFFIGIHHAITDGFSNFTICNLFHKILDEFVEGKGIDDSTIATFTDAKYIQNLLASKQSDGNQQLVSKMRREFEFQRNSHVNMKDHFPKQPKIDITRHLTRDLNEVDTKKLAMKFKSEHASFHSGFLAIADLALVEILGISRSEEVFISAFHATNLRRYDKDENNSLGCQVGPMRLTMDATTIRDSIWDYGRSLNGKLKEGLSQSRPFYEILHFQHISRDGKEGMVNFIRNPTDPRLDYSVSNMGDLSSIFPGMGKNVEVPWRTRVTALHGFGITLCHNLQTFRGKQLYSMSYTTKYVEDSFANQYADKIFSIINEIVNED